MRANIVKSPQDYSFSSYIHYALRLKDKLIDNDPLYLELGKTAAERQLAYRNMLIAEIVYEILLA